MPEIVNTGPTWKIWRGPQWGHPGGFREEAKDFSWEWGPVGDGTWYARPIFRRNGSRGNGELLPTAEEAQWYAEYCERTPGAHSNWAISRLLDERLKWARAGDIPLDIPADDG